MTRSASPPSGLFVAFLQMFYAANIAIWFWLIIESLSFNMPDVEVWGIQACFIMALVVSALGLYSVMKDQ